MLKPTYIASSNIDCCAYHLGKLYLRFKSGVSYSYASVPYAYFDSLQKVESAGKFFHRYIKKGGFRYEKLSSDPFSA